MKKSLKYLLVSTLLANSLALSLPDFQSQATTRSQSSTSQHSNLEETSEEWSDHDCDQFSRADFLKAVRQSREHLTSVALKGSSGDKNASSNYQAAYRYDAKTGKDLQGYLDYSRGIDHMEVYYLGDSNQNYYLYTERTNKWSAIQMPAAFRLRPNYRLMLDWILDHEADFQFEEGQDDYRLTVLERDFDLSDFTSKTLGITLEPEDTPVEDIYNYMEVRFSKEDFNMTSLNYRCLDPSGEVQGQFEFFGYNQLEASDFRLPEGAEVDSELSGSSQQDGSSSDETESRQQRESESSDQGENRPLPPGAVYNDLDQGSWGSVAKEALAYAQEGLYELVSLKWLTWEPVSRLSSHLTWRASQLFRP